MASGSAVFYCSDDDCCVPTSDSRIAMCPRLQKTLSVTPYRWESEISAKITEKIRFAPYALLPRHGSRSTKCLGSHRYRLVASKSFHPLRCCFLVVYRAVLLCCSAANQYCYLLARVLLSTWPYQSTTRPQAFVRSGDYIHYIHKAVSVRVPVHTKKSQCAGGKPAPLTHRPIPLAVIIH